MAGTQFPRRGETDRATALQYNETWSASESTERSSLRCEKVGGALVVKNLIGVLGTLVQDENDGWYEAETIAGRYVGQFESKREAMEALADWA